MPYLSVTEDDITEAIDGLELSYSVSVSRPAVLIDDGHIPWLPSKKPSIDSYFWKRYRDYLNATGLPAGVISRMDDATDRVLGLLDDPERDGNWDRWGLVLGHVQSGKTANYIGLVNKAADAGYKVIIIIAGVHNRLRNQTQTRVDQGFIGRNSSALLDKKAARNFVGVRKFDEARSPMTLTNATRDFSKNIATSVGLSVNNLNEPVVLVIKKNATTLRNLIEWFRSNSSVGQHQTISSPMLLIDDEADNASINTSKNPEATSKINGQIRKLLRLFERSAYVGYTATPFANVFIDPDAESDMIGQDLFPRDFIISLDPPSNYFGPGLFFDGDGDSPYLRRIEDDEASASSRKNQDFLTEGLAGSLREAVRTFILAKAIHNLRGNRRIHASMLVNASPRIQHHHVIRDRIQEYLGEVVNQISAFGGLSVPQADKYSHLRALHETFDAEYSETEFQWDAVLPALRDAALPIQVVSVNSHSADSLDYDKYEGSGLTVIAVGGYSLSRGLTLEGLMVSYFLRSSKMYDTLMQMGRWFGYRPGYQDLCRVWMTDEAIGWYEHINDATEQLRSEIKTMESYGARPMDFGLRVRSHPDTLLVTAKNKMGTSTDVTTSLGLSLSFIETAILRWNSDARSSNLRTAAKLLSTLRERIGLPESARGRYVFRDVDVDAVTEFIVGWENARQSYKTDPELVVEYIRNNIGSLPRWDVAFLGRSEHADIAVSTSLGLPLTPRLRSKGTTNEVPGIIRVTNKQRVGGATDEAIGLSRQQLDDIKLAHAESGKTSAISSLEYRKVRSRPLLLIHLLRMQDAQGDIDGMDTIAWGISFPQVGMAERTVTYTVNKVWIQEYLGSSEDVDDEDLDVEQLNDEKLKG